MNTSLKHLSAFQRDILYVVADLDTPYGLGIKRGLEEYYDEDVNTGRVYQNLNRLVDMEYIEKSEIDKRTNTYTLTQMAVIAMKNRHHWQRTQAKRRIQIEALQADSRLQQ